MRKKKQICKNCGLYDKKAGLCRVVILYNGERICLPVEPKDACFYNNKFIALEEDGKTEFVPEVKQVRFWVEDPTTGQPTDGSGIVKMEYPEDFFGSTSDPLD